MTMVERLIRRIVQQNPRSSFGDVWVRCSEHCKSRSYVRSEVTRLVTEGIIKADRSDGIVRYTIIEGDPQPLPVVPIPRATRLRAADTLGEDMLDLLRRVGQMSAEDLRMRLCVASAQRFQRELGRLVRARKVSSSQAGYRYREAS